MNWNAPKALALAMAAALAAPAAQATNGYFKIGYGTKNRGLAGAGVALGTDSLAPGVNPATLTQVGNRVDFGVELFSPKRHARLDA
ncbi:MAG: long-chain fatty acid transporter, partial [Gammaproteobacteria bacterium]